MDQRRRQVGRPSHRRRLLDLDDAPALDASDETALDAIRRQLDEEFDAGPEAVETRPTSEPEPRPRLAPDNEKRSRTVPEREARPRPAPDAALGVRPAPARDPRDRMHRAWGRPERFRDERPVQPAPRMLREPADRFPPSRIPVRWREMEPPPPREPKPRHGLFLTIVLAAALAGGVGGALLTVLMLTGVGGDPLQESWGRVVAAARDSGLVDMASAVKDRALSVDPWDSDREDAAQRSARSPQVTASRPPSPSPHRGPVTTSEIPEPVQRRAPGQEPAGAPGSRDLRDLVAAGRDAYVRRDYATAELLFAQAVQRSLDDGLLRYHHAIALMGLGRFNEARTELRNALRLGVDPVVADEAQQALAQLTPDRRRR